MLSNYELQQYFLDYIKKSAEGNPIDKEFVCIRLAGFNIRPEQEPYTPIMDIFNDFLLRYKDGNGIKCRWFKDNPYFLYFFNGTLNSNEIKLYIPQDKNHIKESSKQLFDFLASSGINHQSKIASEIRNDDIVVRVNNMEDAKKVIEYFSNNPYMQEGLIKVNPFVPSYNGVGITMDNTFSYNSTVGQIIANFYNYLRNRNMLELFNVETLNWYVKEIIPSIQDLDLKDIYILISKVTTPDFKIEDFFEHVDSKSTDKYSYGRVRIVDPSVYLQVAIENNEEFYPGNAFYAVLHYIDGDATGFTRKNNIRKSLVRHLAPGELIPIMRNKLQINGVAIPRSDEELVAQYLNIIMPKKKENEESMDPFEIIKSAYLHTLEVHGHAQAVGAMERMLANKDLMYFTNKMGDRTKLQQLGNLDYMSIVLEHIDLNNLNVSNIQEIVYRFEQLVEQETKKITK